MPTRRSITLTLASLLTTGGARAVSGEHLVWVSGEVPPYLSRGAHGPQGYAFELYQRICKQAELGGELHFYPWARAMRLLQGGQAHAGLVVARSPDRESRFQWLFPVGNFRFAIFSRPEDGPMPVHVESLRSRRIGSLRASASRELLTTLQMPQVVEGKDYPELLTLLRRGVVDVAIMPEPVMRHMLAQQQPSAPLRATELDIHLDLYAVAGPAMSDDARRRILAAHQQLVDSGFVGQLKKRHPDAFFND